MSLSRLITDLHTWYQSHARILPWRNDPQPYKVWISEIMLQQTQVTTVIPYFERFIKRFPDVSSLAGADEDTAMQYWAGLGYYSRARNMVKSARILESYGHFPEEKEELLRLPGIGPYTAGAILSIAFNRPVPILDANIERVLSRFRLVGEDNWKSTLWKYSAFAVRQADRQGIPPRDINQALMELGALVCTKTPDCPHCPLNRECKSARDGVQSAYPPKKGRKQWKQVEETVICFAGDTGDVLIRKTPEGRWRAGLWDFPLLDECGKPDSILGSVKSKAIVTNHKISRTTIISDSSNGIPERGKWVPLQSLLKGTDAPAVGAALRKSLHLVGKILKTKTKPR